MENEARELIPSAYFKNNRISASIVEIFINDAVHQLGKTTDERLIVMWAAKHVAFHWDNSVGQLRDFPTFLNAVRMRVIKNSTQKRIALAC